MCSDDMIMDSYPDKAHMAEVERIAVDTIVREDSVQADDAELLNLIDTIKPHKIDGRDETEKRKAYLKEKREKWTFNAYEFSWVMNRDLYKFKPEDLKDGKFYACLMMPLVILLSMIIMTASLYKKYRLVCNLAFANMLLLLTLGLLLYIDSDDLDALRYGYYMSIFNTIAITLLGFRAKRINI